MDRTDRRTEPEKARDRAAIIGAFGDFTLKFEAAGVAGRHGSSRLSGSGSVKASGEKRAAGDVETTGSGRMGG